MRCKKVAILHRLPAIFFEQLILEPNGIPSVWNLPAVLEHDAPKLTDFGDNIMLQIIDFDHVYDFGLIQSKIIVI
jgi:hypothetical protein